MSETSHFDKIDAAVSKTKFCSLNSPMYKSGVRKRLNIRFYSPDPGRDVNINVCFFSGLTLFLVLVCEPVCFFL